LQGYFWGSGDDEQHRIAFAKATKNLTFDRLDREFWDTAKTENGGFEAAAKRYAQDPFLPQGCIC
jgi:hypothetical protein